MKKPIIISILCVALTVVVLLWGFQQRETNAPVNREHYALLIESDTGSFVMQLRRGMQQAANEAGAELSIYTPDHFSQAQALSGVVIWLKDSAAGLRLLGDTPAVVVNQNLADAVCVQSDDQSAGKQLLRYALAHCAPEGVLLIRDDEDARATERSDAAEAVARESGVQTLLYEEGLRLPDDCAYAVATSRRATLALAEQKRTGLFGGYLLGVDTGDRRVNDLEAGLVEAMALDSPYAMGYLAFEQARMLASGFPAEGALTRVLLATRDNMYLAENVKQVFPLLQ